MLQLLLVAYGWEGSHWGDRLALCVSQVLLPHSREVVARLPCPLLQHDARELCFQAVVHPVEDLSVT